MKCTSIISFFLTLALLSCCSVSHEAAVKDLAADNSAATNNVALILTARVLTDGDRADYPVIVAKMKAAFSELSGGSKFSLIAKQWQTRADLLENLEKAARDAGENGTIFWYVSSHGRDGKLRSYDAQTLESSELVDALRRGRTVEGTFTPIKRLYMIFDFCEAEVAASDFNSAATPLKLVDVTTAHDQDSAAIKLIQAFRPPSGVDTGSSQFALQGNPPIASQMMIYGVASKVQSTYSYNFLNAVADSLASVKYGSQVTLGDFFAQTTENIAINSQSSASMRREYPVPQQAMIFTYPDNSFLREKLYGNLTATWENAATPCPPWKTYPWSFAHGRDLTGECIDSEQYCDCIRIVDRNKNSVCRIAGPRLKTSLYEEPAEADQHIASNYCNVTCEQIAIRYKTEILAKCGGKYIVKNAIQHAEIADLNSMLSND